MQKKRNSELSYEEKDINSKVVSASDKAYACSSIAEVKIILLKA